MAVKKEIAQAIQKRFLNAVTQLNLPHEGVELAKVTGIKEPTVSAYLSSKRTVSLSFLRKFCEGYGLDYEYLKTGKERVKKIIDDHQDGEPTAKQILYVLSKVIDKQTDILTKIDKEMAREETQAKMEANLTALLERQEGDFGIVVELLRRDVSREAKSNPGKAKQILEEILSRIGPELSPKLKEGISAG